MGVACALILTLALFTYIFWPEKLGEAEVAKTRADYLRERRDVIYDNLRDLQFEYLAGKHPEPDYAHQRASLEDEAAGVLAELDRANGPTSAPSGDQRRTGSQRR